MPPKRRPRCGYCLKEFFKAKDIQLHITNTPRCRAARNRPRCHPIREPSPEEKSSQNAVSTHPDGMNTDAQHQEADYVPTVSYHDRLFKVILASLPIWSAQWGSTRIQLHFRRRIKDAAP
jgi:hypothetical protein